MSEAGSGCIFVEIDNACKCGNPKSYLYGRTCSEICNHAKFAKKNEDLIKNQFKKVLRLSHQYMQESSKFNKMCHDYYGDVGYSDANEDYIIDSLDYGIGTLPFKEFDEIMKKINKDRELNGDDNHE